MTIETALYPNQLNATLPPQSDIVREGAGHLRLLKTVVKTTFPNLGGAWNATQTEANYIVGVTSPIQAQINSKGAIAGQTWTGAHVFSGSAAVPTLAQGTNTTGAASTAFVQAEWATRLPNYTAPITASSTELNRLVGVTSGVQSQINAKGAIAGQDWTGAHSFAGATSVPTLAAGSNTTGAASTAFVQADFLQKFPNYTAPVNASTAELNYLVGLTGAIQPQLSNQVSGPIHAATAKTTPTDADELGITDSAASWGLKKLTFANLKAWLGSLFVSKSGDTINGDLNFSGTGRRITGDFSNGALADRLLFQTNQPNTTTSIGALPSGSGAESRLTLINNSNTTNASGLDFRALPTEMQIRANTYGAGFLPMTFSIGGAERLRIDTSGNVLVTGGGGLGYGVGSGGTVTQATSKATAVTLNKPSGQITMNGAALAAGAMVSFSLQNSFITTGDTLVLSMVETFTSTNYSLSTGINSGGASINVRNASAGSLSQAIIINFAVVKGATS